MEVTNGQQWQPPSLPPPHGGLLMGLPVSFLWSGDNSPAKLYNTPYRKHWRICTSELEFRSFLKPSRNLVAVPPQNDRCGRTMGGSQKPRQTVQPTTYSLYAF